jgi:hypothetical protein
MDNEQLEKEFGIAVMPLSKEVALELIDILAQGIQEIINEDDVIELVFCSHKQALWKFRPHLSTRVLLGLLEVSIIPRNLFYDVPTREDILKMIDDYYNNQ